MRRIAFSKLLMIVVFVPLAAAILCVATLAYESWVRYNDLTRASSLLQLATATGRLGGIAIPAEGVATSDMKTRGDNKAALDALRRKTDELYRGVREAAAASLVKHAKIEEALRSLDEKMRDIAVMRERVDARIAPAIDTDRATVASAAQRCADLVATAAAAASDPILSRRIFAIYATLQFNSSALVGRGVSTRALQNGRLPNDALLLMARSINRNAIFINLFYDFAPPEAVKAYQSFDAANGRALQELREFILRNAGTPATESQIRDWVDLQRELPIVMSTVLNSTLDLIGAEAEQMVSKEWRNLVIFFGIILAMLAVVLVTSRMAVAMLRHLLGGLAHTMEKLRDGVYDVTVPSVQRSDEIGAMAQATESFRDNLVRYIARLAWQASHDELTELVNRREFESRLDKAMQGLTRNADCHALMFLDLDRFKVVNDTCGHAAGDQLLRNVTAELREQLRDTDLLARLGGDEFAVLIESCKPELAAAAAERLRHTIERLSFVWNGRAFRVTASIGLAYLTEPDTPIEDALRTADVACYMAKERGRNRVQIHHLADSEVQQRFGEMAWVQRIQNGIERDRLCLYAQKIQPLHGGDLDDAHLEVLLRLHEEGVGIVLPNSFIPAAERYGLMPQIDRWVVRKSFRILADRMHGADRAAIATCAINLSGATFNDEGFSSFVREQFDICRIPPAMICFEITETSAIRDIATAEQFIRSLRQLGCRFALDDFGSGMSSFAYLKHLPVDFLKIDGTFVRDMLTDRIDRAMVEMIAHIGRVMGKRTIAEFVEDQATLAALRDIVVDFAQGYVVGTPQPLEAVIESLARSTRRVA